MSPKERSPYAREPLSVTLAGAHLAVPYAPAAVWVNALCEGSGHFTLITSLLPERDTAAVVDRVLNGGVTLEDVQKAAESLLSAAAPYSWWKTARLLSASARQDIAGSLTLSGLDPWELTPAQWATAVYASLVKGLESKDKFKVDAVLDDPPAGVTDEWMDESEFQAMIAAARNAPGQR